MPFTYDRERSPTCASCDQVFGAHCQTCGSCAGEVHDECCDPG